MIAFVAIQFPPRQGERVCLLPFTANHAIRIKRDEDGSIS